MSTEPRTAPFELVMPGLLFMIVAAFDSQVSIVGLAFRLVIGVTGAILILYADDIDQHATRSRSTTGLAPAATDPIPEVLEFQGRKMAVIRAPVGRIRK